MDIQTKVKTVRRTIISLEPEGQPNNRPVMAVVPTVETQRRQIKVNLDEPSSVPYIFSTIRDFMTMVPGAYVTCEGVSQRRPGGYFVNALDGLRHTVDTALESGNSNSELAKNMKQVLEAKFCLICNVRSSSAIVQLLKTNYRLLNESPSARAATRDLEQTKQLLSDSGDKISQLQEENKQLKDIIAKRAIVDVKQIHHETKELDELQQLRQKVVDLEAALSEEKQANGTRNTYLRSKNIKLEDQIEDFETLYGTVKKVKRFWKHKFTESASQRDICHAHAELCSEMKSW